jgi:hypothetical protein
MKRIIILYTILLVLSSCSDGLLEDCEVIQEWKVQKYKIEKKQCPDLVLAHYFRYEISIDGKTNGTFAFRIDTCIFRWQANRESFLTLNICDNTVVEVKPDKKLIDIATVDSIRIYSSNLKQSKLLIRNQVKKVIKDWNESKTSDYRDKPVDSVFYPTYQYRLTVYTKDGKTEFLCSNFLISNKTKWTYYIDNDEDVEYFNKLWNK